MFFESFEYGSKMVSRTKHFQSLYDSLSAVCRDHFVELPLDSWKMDDSTQCISFTMRNQEQLNNWKVINGQFRNQNIKKKLVFRS